MSILLFQLFVMRISALLIIFFYCLQNPATAQTGNQWNNKRAAVVLTYDDALFVHLKNVAPALDSLNLKGTFYLTCKEPAFTEHLKDWKRIALNGHELGNHTLFHPCLGGPGREWVSADYDLRNYSVRRMKDEVRMTNVMLRAVDGKSKRTFAYPCGDLRVHDSLYLDPKEFVAARGVEAKLIGRDEKELYNLSSFAVNNQSGEELINEVKRAIQEGKALVFLFHGVGGEHDLNVSLEAHRQLLHFLKAHEKEIWTTTFIELAEWLKR